MELNQSIAKIYNAPKATGFKHMLCIYLEPQCLHPYITRYFKTKNEAKNVAKEINALSWNY